MVSRTLLTVLVACSAADAAAQSHEPAAAPATSAPAAPAAATDHAPAAAGATRRVPVVSRITLQPAPPAAAGHAETDPDAAPAPASTPTKGYVRTGAPRRAAAAEQQTGDAGHGASGKPKPLVSGAALLPAKPPAASPDEHATPSPEATPAEAGAAAPAASPAPAAPADDHGAADRKPATLSVVHGRIAAALAEARKSGGAVTKPVETAPRLAAAPLARPGGDGPAAPRVSLTWPEPRWSLTWPAPGRIALTWPAFSPPATAGRNDPQ